MLVIGIVVALLALLAFISALSEERSPRIAAILVLFAGALVVLALTRHPGGYRLADVPNAFYRVFDRVLR